METELESEQTTPYVRAHPLYDGVQAVDPIEETQFSLLTDEPVDPTPCDSDQFYFPVDTAARIRAAELETPYGVSMWVRNGEDGTTVEEVDEDEVTVPENRYNIELGSTGVKVYLAVDGALEITPKQSGTQIALEDAQEIKVGVRSFHEQPASTVTTTDDPLDVMEALSTLGSALKTTSPERSFPTLRGHPPLIERGSELEIPSEARPPDTGIRIEVPPDLEYIYPVASLVYYLGARVEAAVEPRLIADGRTFSLQTGYDFETTVSRVLKQLFLLDAVVRTEGYYDVDLHERNLVEADIDQSFEELYELPIAERVRRYLSIPFGDIAHAIPTWKLTVDITPDIEYVSALPFVADELAVVRCPDESITQSDMLDDLSEQIEEFFRSDPSSFPRRGIARSSGTDLSASGASETVFEPTEAESIEQAYVGEGIPYGASKMTIGSYYRRLEFEPSSEPLISVAVVCNDPKMADENVVSEIYGTRDWVDFDISFHEELTTEELESILRSDQDFLHYIGHVDDEGIRCSDGFLDAKELDRVGTSAFLLNACNSYEQGRALVENGALSGITTITDILDKGATAVGQTVARLLNEGFSLASIIPLIKEHESIGHHYVVIGDGSLSLVKNESGTPHSIEIEQSGDERYDVAVYGYPNTVKSLGTMFRPYINEVNRRYLNSGKMDEFTLTRDDLVDFLMKQNLPVEYDDALTWSYDLDLND